MRENIPKNIHRELVVDNFAGAGGASLGIEQGIGVAIDIAINHDLAAIEMHKANHPDTFHFCENIWKVHPTEATKGRPVGLAWFSPDCTHFSRAKGGRPVKKNIRGLAWVVVRWAKLVKPRVIILENVAEFAEWGPLTADNRSDPAGKGRTFDLWVEKLRQLGYQVQWRELTAADYGAPTIRRRLFLIARCDGMPIVWPEATHGKGPGLKPYRAAAECINFSLPCPSIFLTKAEAKKLKLNIRRPLAENTMRRIARGLRKFVIEAKEPFIVTCNHGGSGFRGQGISEPMKTITAARDAHGLVVPYIEGIDHQGSNGGCVWDVKTPVRTVTKENRFALISPYLTKYHGAKSKTEVRGGRCDETIRTLDASNRYGLVTAFLSKYFTGVTGSKLDSPSPTVTAIDHNALVAAHLSRYHGQSVGSVPNGPAPTVLEKSHDALVAAHLTKLYGTCRDGADMRGPAPTVTGTGQHIGEVRAFLIKYYGTNVGSDLKQPAHTVTSKHRLGLVTVAGKQYQIADIGLRMLTPRELARAQGFPDSYILTGTKTSQVAKIGNSVCPQLAKVLVEANVKLQVIEKEFVA